MKLIYILQCSMLIIRRMLSQMSLNEYNYIMQGRDWPGQCVAGTQQSPINIVDKFNTELDDDNVIEFDYYMTQDFASQKNKFYYDGKNLEVVAKIGNLYYYYVDGTQETYQAEKIIIKYPSEHVITFNGQSPRQSMEMQIEHSFIHSTNNDLTFKKMRVQKAIVSILFKDVAFFDMGDGFLTKMAIDGKFIRPDGSSQVLLEGNYLDSEAKIKGGVEYGLDYTALELLKNILNADTHVYKYYGSETRPPCMENVHWFVFRQVRSMSRKQMEFFKAQLTKLKTNSQSKFKIHHFYGNNRGLQYYDDFRYGNIQSMKNAIIRISALPFPRT